MFEVHSLSQADVLRAGEVTLAELGREATDRIKPTIASIQVITNVNPYQAQLLNRFTRGTMLVAGQTMLVVEVAPAAYINLAANEAEKAAPVNLMHASRPSGVSAGSGWPAGRRTSWPRGRPRSPRSRP